MSSKFCVTLSCARDGGDKATAAFVIANAALGSDKDTLVFLVSEGVHLSQQGYADGIHDAGSAPLAELIASFIAGGGRLYACSSCFTRRQLEEQRLVPGAKVVGGATLVEFLTDGCPCVSL